VIERGRVEPFRQRPSAAAERAEEGIDAGLVGLGGVLDLRAVAGVALELVGKRRERERLDEVLAHAVGDRLANAVRVARRGDRDHVDRRGRARA
jgi:hypothetical protein